MESDIAVLIGCSISLIGSSYFKLGKYSFETISYLKIALTFFTPYSSMQNTAETVSLKWNAIEKAHTPFSETFSAENVKV